MNTLKLTTKESAILNDIEAVLRKHGASGDQRLYSIEGSIHVVDMAIEDIDHRVTKTSFDLHGHFKDGVISAIEASASRTIEQSLFRVAQKEASAFSAEGLSTTEILNRLVGVNAQFSATE